MERRLAQHGLYEPRVAGQHLTDDFESYDRQVCLPSCSQEMHDPSPRQRNARVAGNRLARSPEIDAVPELALGGADTATSPGRAREAAFLDGIAERVSAAACLARGTAVVRAATVVGGTARAFPVQLSRPGRSLETALTLATARAAGDILGTARVASDAPKRTARRRGIGAASVRARCRGTLGITAVPAGQHRSQPVDAGETEHSAPRVRLDHVTTEVVKRVAATHAAVITSCAGSGDSTLWRRQLRHSRENPILLSRRRGERRMDGSWSVESASWRRHSASLDEAARRACWLLLVGEPGIGKTTIWSAVLQEAMAHADTVLAARPSEAESDFPSPC